MRNLAISPHLYHAQHLKSRMCPDIQLAYKAQQISHARNPDNYLRRPPHASTIKSTRVAACLVSLVRQYLTRKPLPRGFFCLDRHPRPFTGFNPSTGGAATEKDSLCWTSQRASASCSESDPTGARAGRMAASKLGGSAFEVGVTRNVGVLVVRQNDGTRKAILRSFRLLHRRKHPAADRWTIQAGRRFNRRAGGGGGAHRLSDVRL